MTKYPVIAQALIGIPALFFTIAMLLLAALTNADVSPQYRQDMQWQGYDPYVIRFQSTGCNEYNFDNGPLAQDLTIKGMPPDTALLPNSYGEILRNGIQAAIEKGATMTRNTYTPGSLTIDLPKSGTDGDTCQGVFYLVFSASSATPSINNNTVNTTSTTSSTPSSTTSTSLSSTSTPSSPLDNIVNTIKQFFNAVFGWLFKATS